MKNIYFNYYNSDIKQVKPMGLVSLDKFINSVKNPKPKMIEILEKIEFYSKIKDETNRAKYKQMLYFFTPSIICDYRNYKGIKQFTGLATLDFDKLESYEYAQELKEHLFNEFDFIICAWLSSSKLGVRCLVHIPAASSVDEFKQYYGSLIQDFGIYNGFDTAPKNCVLPLFYSRDSNILFREKYSLYDKKFIPEPVAPKTQPIRIYKNKKVEVIKKMVHTALSKVNNYGHPPLRAISYAVGGYVASDYLTVDEAIDILSDAIDGNSYLSQKASIYKTTAKTMINKGQSEPLILDFNN
jgi:hypothetical protein